MKDHHLLLLLSGALLFFIQTSTGQKTPPPIHHNLPPGLEIVDPKSLGFDESQIDLSSLLGGAVPGGVPGNLKLTPINAGIDPKTGLKTQILTVGFDGEEGLNLDDFELPPAGGNNTELVNSAFASFKEYFKGKQGQSQSQPQQQQQQRRRKIPQKKKVASAAAPPKVVELDSEQIEKLLATGKLKSKNVGDNQVIEITQEQLNALYGLENGSEFKELLGGAEVVGEVVRDHGGQQQQGQGERGVVQGGQQGQGHPPRGVVQVTKGTTTTERTTERPRQQQVQVQQPQTQPPRVIQLRPEVAPQYQYQTTTLSPPIIYQFNSNDFLEQQRRPPQQQQFYQQQPIQSTGRFPPIQQIQQQHPQEQQPQKHIKTPTFEFISVPPVTAFSSQNSGFKQDPLPQSGSNSQGKVIFPSSSSSSSGSQQRFNRQLTKSALNTYFEDDGLNYKDLSGGRGDGV